jgi:hypothetical protein
MEQGFGKCERGEGKRREQLKPLLLLVVVVVVVLLLLLPSSASPSLYDLNKQAPTVLTHTHLSLLSPSAAPSFYQTRRPAAATTPLSKGNGRTASSIVSTNGPRLASSRASSPAFPWPCFPKGRACVTTGKEEEGRAGEREEKRDVLALLLRFRVLTRTYLVLSFFLSSISSLFYHRLVLGGLIACAFASIILCLFEEILLYFYPFVLFLLTFFILRRVRRRYSLPSYFGGEEDKKQG